MVLLYNKDVRDLSIKGVITDKNAKQTEIGVADILSYSSNAQIGSDGLPLGATEAASFSLEIDNTGRKYTPEDFDSAEVHMYSGIRVEPRNHILNSAFLFDRRDWEDSGIPTRREIVEQGGKKWCHIVGSGNARRQGIEQRVDNVHTMTVEGGRQYVFSALVRGGAARQRLTVGFYWRDLREVVDDDWHTWTVSASDQRMSFTVTPPADADRFEMFIGVDDDETAYDVYFTEMMLETGYQVSDEWTPAPEDYDATYADGYAWSDFGVWYVDSASAPEQSVSIRLSGYDALATKFESLFVDDAHNYPNTVENLFLTVATAAGIRTKEPNFTNAKLRIVAMPEWSEGTTIRDVLSYCAICAGGFARVARNGQLEIASFSAGQIYELGPERYRTFTLTGGAPYAFNAIEAMMDADTEEYTRYALDGAISPNATNTIQLDYNPLLTADVVNSVVYDMRGIGMDAGKLTWGGDPYVVLGDYYRVTTLSGRVYKIMVTSQSFSFDGGLSASETCSLPSANAVASSSYSTSANAFDLNGNLRASRVAGLNNAVVAATEAHFKHLTGETAEFDSLLSSFIEALNLVAGKISAGVIDADEFYADVAQIANALISEAHITSAQIDDLAAVIVEAFTAQIGSADIGYAQVKDLITKQAIITDGIGDTLYIERLFVTSANILGATLGKLVLRGSDGNYYEVVIASDGTISTQQVTVSTGEIAAGETSDGRQIVATDANIRDLNAQSLRASQAIIGSIFTEALTAGKIQASEALLASATIPTLYSTTIQAIGNSLDLKANESIRLIVSDAVEGMDEKVQAVDKKATTNATEIEQTKKMIELRATKEELDALGNRVSEAESTIEVQAGLIQSKVSSADVQSMIDAIPADARNYALGTSKSKEIPKGSSILYELSPEYPYLSGRRVFISFDLNFIDFVMDKDTLLIAVGGYDGSTILEFQNKSIDIESPANEVVHVVFDISSDTEKYFQTKNLSLIIGTESSENDHIISGKKIVSNVMLNTGDKAAIWSQAPEDMVTEEKVESIIEQKADSIRLKADKISWQSTYSSMSENGKLTCTGADINGTFSWDSTYSSMTEDGKLRCTGAEIDGTFHAESNWNGIDVGEDGYLTCFSYWNWLKLREGEIHGGTYSNGYGGSESEHGSITFNGSYNTDEGVLDGIHMKSPLLILGCRNLAAENYDGSSSYLCGEGKITVLTPGSGSNINKTTYTFKHGLLANRL